MIHPMPRRRFLQASAGVGLGAGLGLGALGITPAHAEEMIVRADGVRLRAEIEPTVKWIEETPRGQILDAAVGHMRNGLAYRDLMAGLFLAGIRNIKPRPVGFKFHAVMVIHSAHLMGQSAAEDERLIPMFWALDNFKASQEADVREGDWTLGDVEERHLPSASRAKSAFVKAMEDWDETAADVATAALCRSHGAAETMEQFWTYAVRDHRNIGHKAIFAAQSWRTLQTIGWPNAEPVLRSLAFGMLDRQGDSGRNAVGPYATNLELLKTIREDWAVGRSDEGATNAFAQTLRTASPEQSSREAANLLNQGIAPSTIWDAITLASSELLVRKPGIIALHAMTSANALHYIFGQSGNPSTRQMALLQAAGWTAMFRDALGQIDGPMLDSFEPVEMAARGDDAIGEIFATVQESRTRAVGKALGFLAQGGSPESLFAAGRRRIFHAGRDSHDFKYAAAAWEEARLASSPRWTSALAASTLSYVPGSDATESPLMIRARAAVSSVVRPS